MRYCGMSLLLGIAIAGWCIADAAPRKPEAVAPVQKGLVVHEWGVVRAHHDLELANADMRAIWDALPRFVYGQVSGRRLPKHWINLEIRDRPVIFFHTPRTTDLELRIDIPGGYPGVWWPGTQSPAIQFGRVVGGPEKGKPAQFLEWKLSLKGPPLRNGRAQGMREVDTGHWIKTLRAVDADEVYARVGEQNFGYEREKFIYYDALLPRGPWAAISVDKDKVRVRNPAGYPVFDLTAVDRRLPGRTRVARLARLDAQSASQALNFTEIEETRWSAAAPTTLVRQLKDAGLFEDEAKSLVELCKHDLFFTEGLTLFYRLPQAEYERQMPMKMQPAPEKLVRVGLVLHPHLEPDLAERVAALVRDLDAQNYKTRQQAQKRLESLGQAAFVHLLRLHKKTPELEVRKRIERLLEKYDVRKSLHR
jgi:hypothetical protein